VHPPASSAFDLSNALGRPIGWPRARRASRGSPAFSAEFNPANAVDTEHDNRIRRTG